VPSDVTVYCDNPVKLSNTEHNRILAGRLWSNFALQFFYSSLGCLLMSCFT
jgi:hypothetical protein